MDYRLLVVDDDVKQLRIAKEILEEAIRVQRRALGFAEGDLVRIETCDDARCAATILRSGRSDSRHVVLADVFMPLEPGGQVSLGGGARLIHDSIKAGEIEHDVTLVIMTAFLDDPEAARWVDEVVSEQRRLEAPWALVLAKPQDLAGPLPGRPQMPRGGWAWTVARAVAEQSWARAIVRSRLQELAPHSSHYLALLGECSRLAEMPLVLVTGPAVGRAEAARALHDFSSRCGGEFVRCRLDQAMRQAKAQLKEIERSSGGCGTLFLDAVDADAAVLRKTGDLLAPHLPSPLSDRRRLLAGWTVVIGSGAPVAALSRLASTALGLRSLLAAASHASLEVQPMGELREEIPGLALHYLNRSRQKGEPALKLSGEAERALTDWHWGPDDLGALVRAMDALSTTTEIEVGLGDLVQVLGGSLPPRRVRLDVHRDWAEFVIPTTDTQVRRVRFPERRLAAGRLSGIYPILREMLWDSQWDRERRAEDPSLSDEHAYLTSYEPAKRLRRDPDRPQDWLYGIRGVHPWDTQPDVQRDHLRDKRRALEKSLERVGDICRLSPHEWRLEWEPDVELELKRHLPLTED